jgi:hypothetical protein
MRLSDCGHKVVIEILSNVEKGLITLPTEFSLKRLEELTGCRVQSIGMCFDDYIYKPLLKNGISARKCGTPTVIQLREIKA